jgi:nicotinate-nucleotide pyrophosphorylase (carboxylating)
MNTDFFNSPDIQQLIHLGISEDIGSGDHSSLASLPPGTVGKAKMLLKQDGIIAGLPLVVNIFNTIDPHLTIVLMAEDGQPKRTGDILLTVEGSVHSILSSERLVLNFIQRLSGIASMTGQLVELAGQFGQTQILDTRKTTPGWRRLEKYAVKTGGGTNHRMGLYDMVMLKDNHIDFSGGITKAVQKTVNYLRHNNLSLKIEVETRNMAEVEEALSTGCVDIIMLDNFTPSEVYTAVRHINGRVKTEASGGIHQGNIREYLSTGVDFISLGALTHSAKSLDISLKTMVNHEITAF